jgi:hypothetical protein
MQAKFFKDLLSKAEFVDGFVHVVTSDMLDQSEFWSDDEQEFLEKFKACSNTAAGREFILFLVGYEKMSTYLETVADELGMNSEVEDDEEDDGV